MAIYDNDGTVNYEIGKLYDNDGTTGYQTGKAYDNDGTAHVEVYSAGATLYQNGVCGSLLGSFVVTNKSNTSGFTITDTDVQFTAVSTSSQGPILAVRSANKIDVTDYAAINLDARVAENDGMGTYVCLTTANINVYNPTEIVSGTQVTITNTSSHKKTINVSNLSGSYYLCFVLAGAITHGSNTIYANNITME
ncbi:MAG: hypothetical protein E7488_05985 [Ruminococcaceae bacterium]|nr:hypothetical protein [Oscillospiraceae bacterium]